MIGSAVTALLAIGIAFGIFALICATVAVCGAGLKRRADKASMRAADRNWKRLSDAEQDDILRKL
jgi:hypothetical protein